MKLKLRNISTKSFIIMFGSINFILGFFIGAMITVVSIVSPADQSLGGLGAWSILIFPILNGLLGVMSASFLVPIFNYLSRILGGIELEFEVTQ